ncbi:MAG: amidase [Candidatus Eremiobacteraeota bacterium]|nr:amidase [Candidatus Eremiobacteraeota bacterium]
MTAIEMATAIRAKRVSCREVMQAHLLQISLLNSKVNAIVTLVPQEILLAHADEADRELARGNVRGPLHGMPIGVKDLVDTKDIRTTYGGSPVFKDYVPTTDGYVVVREKNAGGIVVGKTNAPEFGMGSQTFNRVFGATHNPYDLTKTCGGSTGGGAVALACGMVPLADGSDFAASLRNPGNFCNVVGFRPSPGRVANERDWFTLSVAGPVARNVTDCAFFLSVLAGFDRACPIAIDQSGFKFEKHLKRNFKGVRVAMFKDLGLPWQPEVRSAILAQRTVLESLGCIVDDAEPDFSGVNEAFLAERHAHYEAQFGDAMDKAPDMYNEYVHWHVEEGRKLTGPYLTREEQKRVAAFERMHNFMETYEFFILPVNQVLPFPVTEHYPTEIAGVTMENYMAWMKSSYYISAIEHPAISVPAAFSATGLPIGMQIVGRYHDDLGVLQLAYAFEQATKIGARRPPLTQSS